MDINPYSAIVRERPVYAYLIEEPEASDGMYPRVEATIRPLRSLTRDGEPGLCVDIPGMLDADLAIEIGVRDLTPVIEEAARMWYEDRDEAIPDYLSEDAPADGSLPMDDEDMHLCLCPCPDCTTARACAAEGCDECADYLASDGCAD